jgi:hypothetical protein
MMEIPYLGEFLASLKSAKLDDLVDRCHYLFTCGLLILFAIVVGSKQTFGQPIQCMTHAEFPSHWIDYVHEYCFITSTYHVHRTEEDHFDLTLEEPKKTVEVNYYQWVPYILALQALLFYLPHLFWTSTEASADMDLQSIVDKATQVRSTTSEERVGGAKEIGKYMNQIWEFRRNRHSTGLGYWSTVCYLGSKAMNLINLLGQFYLINKIIGEGDKYWGLKIIDQGMNGVYWTQTGFFPRITYCDFEQTTLANVEQRTVQCALMINMLNEKVFVTVYLWFGLLLIPTIFNLVYTCALFAFSFMRLWQAKRYLEPVKALRTHVGVRLSYNEADHQVSKFVVQVLGLDGLLLLRFIHSHAGLLVASEVARELYRSWETQTQTPMQHVNGGGDGYAIRPEPDEKFPFLPRKDQ